MLCSREEFSFRYVYVSMLVGTKRRYTHKWFKNYRLETLLEDDIVKAKRKTSTLQICKRISRSLFKCFQQLFSFFFILGTKHSPQYGFGFRISSKMSFTSAGIKKLISRSYKRCNWSFLISLPGNLSLVIGSCILMQYSDNKSLIWWLWRIQKQLLNLFCVVYKEVFLGKIKGEWESRRKQPH